MQLVTQLLQHVPTRQRRAHVVRVEVPEARRQQEPWHMREKGIVGGPSREEELGPELAAALAGGKVGVETLEHARAPLRLGLPQTEPTYQRFLVEIVAQQHLVAALSRQYDFD